MFLKSLIKLLILILATLFKLHSQQFSGGYYHSLAICSDSTIYGWGDNSAYRLGLGNTQDKLLPVKIPGIDKVIAVSCGFNFSIALRADSTVWSWGFNGYGQLGQSSSQSFFKTPTKIPGLSGIVAISAGADYALALKGDGTAWAWGHNNQGTLGDSTTADKSAPVQVKGLTGITAICAGSFDDSFFLKNDSTVWGCGWNVSGELGDGTSKKRTAPVKAIGISKVVKIGGGDASILVIKDDSTLWGWGVNNKGQLMTNTFGYSYTPKKIPGFNNVVDVSRGAASSFVLTSDGTLWSAGLNDEGQLGDSTIGTTGANPPVKVYGLAGKVSDVEAGSYYVMARKKDGTLCAWGDNSQGQLGNGTKTNAIIPVNVPLLCFSNLSSEEEIEGDFSIAVYPNPANDFVFIKTGNEQGALQVDIIDIMGKVVEQKTFYNVSDEIKMPLSCIPGMYFVYIKVEKKSIVTRLIKQ